VMVARLLGLSEVPSPPDVADALALALCHIASSRVEYLSKATALLMGGAESP
jgi:crossover junction endodeoxyribonuclease RuvC